MVAGVIARIVIDIEGSYFDRVPNVLPGVETWTKVGNRWDLSVSEHRPYAREDGSYYYDIQDTDQNRLTALIFWLRRGCTVTRIVDEGDTPFPTKTQDEFHKKDKLDAETDRKDLEVANKAIPPLEKKLGKLESDLAKVQNRYDKQGDLARIDAKKPNKEIMESLEKEISQLEKSVEDTQVKLTVAIEERRVLLTKV